MITYSGDDFCGDEVTSPDTVPTPPAPRQPFFATRSTRQWFEAWDDLVAAGYAVSQAHPESGEDWQYMGHWPLEHDQWAVDFRHRMHPRHEGRRVYLRIIAGRATVRII